MCAIHGILGKRVFYIEKMIDAAHHRGPDGNGKWFDDDITLGHNLLSIVDTETNSQQPWIHNNLVIVYNGEIYNYKELQSELNYDFKTDTDTEVLAVGLEKYGIDFIDKLDGMFAFACYNKDTKDLIIARDSNGTKPIYYGTHNNIFHFSSEIKSLLEVGFERQVCEHAFKHYYRQGLNTGYLTMFKGIKKFLPGEIRIINIKTNKEKIINLNNKPIPLITETNKRVIQDELRSRLQKAVEMSLMGRRKIGLFLSGGIDSTSILYEMTRLGVKPNTFTSKFELVDPNSRLNEDADLAIQLCKDLNVDNKSVEQSQLDYINSMEQTFYALEEPRQGKSFPTYFNTNKFMSENDITVTLSGDGGDELLVGYKHHLRPNWKAKLKDLGQNNNPLRNPKHCCTVDDQENYLNEWLPRGGLQGDELNDFLYIECLNSLCEDFLIRNDKLGMNFSMEGRFPMLVKVFRDYVRSIPSHLKVDNDFKTKPTYNNKKLFKDAYRNHLPNYILDRNKTGWRFPTDEILVGTRSKPAPNRSLLKDYVRTILDDKELQELFEFNNNDVENRYLNNKDYVNEVKGVGVRSQKELFITMNFAIWRKMFKVSI